MITEVSIADCLRLTKALQRTAEGLQSVADLYDDNVSASRDSRVTELIKALQARRAQLNSHEALKDVAHPSALYAVRHFQFRVATSLIVHAACDRNAQCDFVEIQRRSAERCGKWQIHLHPTVAHGLHRTKRWHHAARRF